MAWPVRCSNMTTWHDAKLALDWPVQQHPHLKAWPGPKTHASQTLGLFACVRYLRKRCSGAAGPGAGSAYLMLQLRSREMA